MKFKITLFLIVATISYCLGQQTSANFGTFSIRDLIDLHKMSPPRQESYILAKNFNYTGIDEVGPLGQAKTFYFALIPIMVFYL